MATKLEGGGGKAIVTGPLKKIPFFAASLRYNCLFDHSYLVQKHKGQTRGFVGAAG